MPKFSKVLGVLPMFGISGTFLKLGARGKKSSRRSNRSIRCSSNTRFATGTMTCSTMPQKVASETGLVTNNFGPSQFLPKRASNARRRRQPPYFPEAPGTGANYAFVFLKPHANTDQAIERVKERFASQNIEICKQGGMDAAELDKQRIIDRHYGGLAEKALDIDPTDLFVKPEAQDRFHKAFGLPWKDALATGLVLNARQAMERLQCNEEELDRMWDPLEFDVGKVKFAGGFYCGKIRGIFVINGFYMGMRAMFTKPGRSITYFAVKWEAADLSWEGFRQKFIGSTDPSKAEPGSIRGDFFQCWENLGLANQLSTGENAVHASASSLEALVERMNWLNLSIDEDPFGRALLGNKVNCETIVEWTRDPLVCQGGERRSLFDLVENLDHKECLESLVGLFEDQQKRKIRQPGVSTI